MAHGRPVAIFGGGACTALKKVPGPVVTSGEGARKGGQTEHETDYFLVFLVARPPQGIRPPGPALKKHSEPLKQGGSNRGIFSNRSKTNPSTVYPLDREKKQWKSP